MSIIRRSSDGDQKVVAYYSKHIDQRKTTYEPEMISKFGKWSGKCQE